MVLVRFIVGRNVVLDFSVFSPILIVSTSDDDDDERMCFNVA